MLYDTIIIHIHLLLATPPTVPEQMLPPKVSYDFMYVGGTPVIPPPPETPHLQDLAKVYIYIHIFVYHYYMYMYVCNI